MVKYPFALIATKRSTRQTCHMEFLYRSSCDRNVIVSVAVKHGMNRPSGFPGFILPCLGVHPVQGDPAQPRGALPEDLNSALPIIEKNAEQIVAIGEVGLDFTPRIVNTESGKELQRQVLIRQVEMAKQLNLPLNVHSRSAGRPTIHLLKELGVENALLHAFDGKPSVAMEGVRAGYFFSIPPSIIRSEQVRNEPKNITISADYIAKTKGIPVEQVIEVTTLNALRLFPKLKTFISHL
ncbi:putative deoxyribonuclease TATDN3 [Bagarius yarrelli]|uniref:Putative deoxyribonuclease TATDN3 n=1 Tax=Bagarius yarrelli TaxID=175774 RepID=A0A556U929_BAGYA|nr:putative deoxyribonuclease TATDN3 [Bagarius yarrelli]